RETDRFWHADARMSLADDLGPACDHAGLDEAETAKCGAPDLRHQLGNRPRRAAARAFVRPGRLRLAVTFHRAGGHAIAGRWITGSRPHCSNGTTARRAAFPGECRRAAARPTPTASGSPRSSCSRPRPRML